MTTLLDLMRAPAIIRPVDGAGSVVQGRVHTVHRIGHPKIKHATLARIELHPFGAHWAWGTSFHLNAWGHGYRVGEKWGKFAASQSDALYYGIEEMRGYMQEALDKPPNVTCARRVLEWLDGLG